MSDYDQIKSKEHKALQDANTAKRAKEATEAKAREIMLKDKARVIAGYQFPPKPQHSRESSYYSSAIELFCEQQISHYGFIELIEMIEARTNHCNKALVKTAKTLVNQFTAIKQSGIIEIIVTDAVVDIKTVKDDSRIGHHVVTKLITPAVTYEVTRNTFYQYARKELQGALNAYWYI